AVAFDDPLPIGAVNRERRHRHASAINQRRRAADSNQAAPGPHADERSQPRLLEIERKTIAARAAPAIDEHRFGAKLAHWRRGPVLAAAHRPVVAQRTIQQLDKPIRYLAAAVEPLVNHQPWLGYLSPPHPHQFVLA